MHAQSKGMPSQMQLVLPMLEVIREQGGSAGPRHVAEAMAQRFAVPETITSGTSESARGNVWRRHVRYARQKALALGYLSKDSAHGQWTLAPEASTALDRRAPAVVVTLVVDPQTGATIGAQITLGTSIPTVHTILQSDARTLDWLDDGSVQLIVPSPPYGDLKRYTSVPGQLGDIPNYEDFLREIEVAMREHFRVLMPGGRMVYNVADIVRSRAKHGHYHVLPLHAHTQVMAERVGFQLLNGIIWQKITTGSYEEGPGGVLGQPGQPNQQIKLEIEHLLVMRKPGPYRSVSVEQRRLSQISKTEQALFWRQVWDDVPGARPGKGHPCPFPEEVPYRLARMYSLPGDTVFDPFVGSGSTMKGCMRAGRNSLGVDVSGAYVDMAVANASQFARELAA